MPRARITKDMIVDAAFEIARSEGMENINARTVSQRLGCSTQPVLYHFATIRDIKQAAYEKLDRFHTEYLMRAEEDEADPLLGIGLRYVRFAREEPNLFRFLFQSGFVAEKSLLEMVDSDALTPLLCAMREALSLSAEKTKEVFVTVALFAHGYASLLANNPLGDGEAHIAAHLTRAFRGAVLAVREECA